MHLPIKLWLSVIIDEVDREKSKCQIIIPVCYHTPRSGREGLVITGCTPENFENHVSDVLDIIKNKSDEHKIFFLKSWNEWA